MLRFFASPGDARVFESHPCGGDRKLCVTIEALQSMRREIFFRRPLGNFAGAMRGNRTVSEGGRPADPALLRPKAGPKRVASDADARDRADPGDDCPPLFYA